LSALTQTGAVDLLPYQLHDPSLTLVGDSAAEAAFSALDARFKARTHDTLSLNVYKLQDVADHRAALQAHCLHLLSDCAVTDEGAKYLHVKRDNYQFSRNKFSGSERFVDRLLSHKASDTLPMLPSSQDYLLLTKTYIANVLPHVSMDKFYSYKMREYKNSGGTLDRIDYERTYQVAISYNQHIDNLPVIGSGGKIAVHMTNDGQLVSVEHSVRDIQRVEEVIDGDDLLSPDDARAIALSRLQARGVTGYTLSDEQFGYLQRGRSSAQDYLIPHYAFFFEPSGADGSSKRMVEVVPATLLPHILTLAQHDDDLEAARKRSVYGESDAPDER
jgi:hypothetical protein